MDAAKPAVEKWQNQFDQLIFELAQENEVPAQLLKNLFSRGSRFLARCLPQRQGCWFGPTDRQWGRYSLVVNRSFYDQFCPLEIDKDVCTAKGYANLRPKYQALLRGALGVALMQAAVIVRLGWIFRAQISA